MYPCFFYYFFLMPFLGIDRFCQDIKAMTGFTPGIYWRVCWKFVAPIFLMVFICDAKRFFSTLTNTSLFYHQGIIGYGLWDYKPLEYEGYIYPMWANILGWCIAGSSKFPYISLKIPSIMI